MRRSKFKGSYKDNQKNEIVKSCIQSVSAKTQNTIFHPYGDRNFATHPELDALKD
jgi:hypothetical protein